MASGQVVGSGDAVATGLVANLASSGNNVTGATQYSLEVDNSTDRIFQIDDQTILSRVALSGFVYTRMTEGMPLPRPLTATPGQVAAVVYKAIRNKTNVVYVKWFWRWIMLIIKSIPESIFKKLKL